MTNTLSYKLYGVTPTRRVEAAEGVTTAFTETFRNMLTGMCTLAVECRKLCLQHISRSIQCNRFFAFRTFHITVMCKYKTCDFLTFTHVLFISDVYHFHITVMWKYRTLVSKHSHIFLVLVEHISKYYYQHLACEYEIPFCHITVMWNDRC